MSIFKITRRSRQPKADVFMDCVWDVLERIRKGDLEVTPKSKVRELEAEAKLIFFVFTTCQAGVSADG